MSTKTYDFEGYKFKVKINKTNTDWYKWEISLDPSNDLSQIDRVEYILHPTYPDRIQVKKNVTNGFELDFSGYDGFSMPVNIYLKEKDKNGDNHEINLLFPVETK